LEGREEGNPETEEGQRRKFRGKSQILLN